MQVPEFDRPHSAYMLFYERSEELEPIKRLAQASGVPSNTTPVATIGGTTPANTPSAGPFNVEVRNACHCMPPTFSCISSRAHRTLPAWLIGSPRGSRQWW